MKYAIVIAVVAFVVLPWPFKLAALAAVAIIPLTCIRFESRTA